MENFNYQNGEMYAENVALRKIAECIGTPFFCYSSSTFERNYKAFGHAVAGLDYEICYAVKANSNIAVIALLARLGAGADVVSSGELRRALAAGIPPQKIVFSGVGKTRKELEEALNSGVTRINVESEPELNLLSGIASQLGLTAEISIRINPDVDAKTHEKITTGKSENKFGIDLRLARDAYQRANELPGVNPNGVALHIGSQLTDLEPYTEAYSLAADFVRVLRDDGMVIEHLDLGGGLGITYHDEITPSPAAYGAMVKEVIGNLGVTVTFEPGRVIAGNTGVMVAQVLFVKDGMFKRFCIIDGAMNDLIRPTLYNAYHSVVPLDEPGLNSTYSLMDVVGPICESGDFIAKDRSLPMLAAGDYLAVKTAGAYAAVMGSTYNTRPLAPEVLVNGDKYAIVRRRLTADDLIGLESLPDWVNISNSPIEQNIIND